MPGGPVCQCLFPPPPRWRTCFPDGSSGGPASPPVSPTGLSQEGLRTPSYKNRAIDDFLVDVLEMAQRATEERSVKLMRVGAGERAQAGCRARWGGGVMGFCRRLDCSGSQA